MASALLVFFLLFSVFSVVVGARNKSSNLISLGSSLSPTTQPPSWLSRSGQFAFGFYQQGNNRFSVGIWLVGNSENTVVWTANRDDPPVSSNATLDLTKDGRLLLITGQGEEKPIADRLDAASASMLDSGNFVLYNNDSLIVWASFDHSTDTILGGQNLTRGDGKELVSSASGNDHSSGRFNLIMQDDGNLVAYPVNSSQVSDDSYWSSGTNDEEYYIHLSLHYNGFLVLHTSTGANKLTLAEGSSTDRNRTVVYRATLDPDGIFRLYSHSFDSYGNSNMSIEWQALQDQCQVKGFCGINSFCTLVDTKNYCLCLPGFEYVDPNQKFLGCNRNFTDEGCRGGIGRVTLYNISTIENITWGDYPYSVKYMKKDDCGKSCLEDCNCGAALFQGGNCRKQKLPLRYAKRNLNSSATTAFFKVSSGLVEGANGTSQTTMKQPPLPPPVIYSNKSLIRILAISLGFFTFSCIAVAVSSFFIYRRRVLRYRRLSENMNSGLSEEFTLRLFSSEELEKATECFREELGRGTFGAVYRGTLPEGNRTVAVKRLEKVVEEGEREFRAEMSAIGRTHHRNLVRLLGFCIEGSKRLLVYEYMNNGSLADLLFKAETRPAWNDRVRIAHDVARGILYLHEECDTPIVHCDIKPQNILINLSLTAKISDFGLAKLLMPNQTRTFTGVRGTRGYLAPEWQRNAPISVKADAYSFGIVLLEIICCRRNLEVNVLTADEIILSSWVYNSFVSGELDKLVDNEEVDLKTLERMLKVALWCIQEEPAVRPSMKNVILMLEGIMNTSIPPSPNPSL